MGEKGGGGQCHTWQAEKPSNKWSRSSQCGKMNDAISAWINVPYVPLKGTLSINHITIPSTTAMCAHTPSKPRHTHTYSHICAQIHPLQTISISMNLDVWLWHCGVFTQHYVNVFLQLSTLIILQMWGGGKEEINLLELHYPANEKSSGLTFHMNPIMSTHIMKPSSHLWHKCH